MHTSTYLIDDSDIHVIHNLDWSGDAFVNFTDDRWKKRSTIIPAKLLIQIGKKAAHEHIVSEAISFFEGLELP